MVDNTYKICLQFALVHKFDFKSIKLFRNNNVNIVLENDPTEYNFFY